MVTLLGLGAMCLLIRLGMTLYQSGLVRAKNAAAGTLNLIGDLCVAALAFWLIGGAILTQNRNPFFALKGSNVAFWSGGSSELFFLMTLVLVGSSVAIGAVAERMRFFPMWTLSVLTAGLLIPIGANWAWSGWLFHLGFIDVAGAAWLHLACGTCALVGVMVVGPRTGKYHRDGSASIIPGHNVPMAAAGTVAILAGWIPYLAGCLLYNRKFDAIGPAATNALLAGAAAGLTALLLAHYRFGKPDVIITLIGFMGGLVSVTAGAATIGAPAAVFLGAVAGVLVPMCAIWIDLIFHTDDPVAAIAIHGVGGLWGALACGFLSHGSLGERLRQTGIQLAGVVAIATLALALSAICFLALKATTRLRVSEADEFDGLDLAEHDIGAYPDFQQNTIKSYHLREA